MQEIGINSDSVALIRSGEKTIEVRLGKPRFLKMSEGDILSLRMDEWLEGKLVGSRHDVMRVKITQVLYFESLQEMFEAIDFTAAVPTATSAEEAVEHNRQFYTEQDEAEYGVVAFTIEPVV